MLDTVKPTATAVWIVPGPFRCASVDPEGADQARTFQYIVVPSTKCLLKVLGVLPSTFEWDLVLRTTMYWNVRANIRSKFNRVVLKEANYKFTFFFPTLMQYQSH